MIVYYVVHTVHTQTHTTALHIDPRTLCITSKTKRFPMEIRKMQGQQRQTKYTNKDCISQLSSTYIVATTCTGRWQLRYTIFICVLCLPLPSLHLSDYHWKFICFILYCLHYLKATSRKCLIISNQYLMLLFLINYRL